MSVLISRIIFKGDLGYPPQQLSGAEIRGLAAPTVLGFLADALLAYTDCVVESRFWGIWSSLAPEAPGVGANVDKKAIIHYHDDEGVHYCIPLPAPKASILEQKAEGERVKKASVADIVSDIAFYQESTLTPLYGIVYQRT